MLAVMKCPGYPATECQISGKEFAIRSLLGGRKPRRTCVRLRVEGGAYAYAIYTQEDQRCERGANILYKGRLVRGPLVAVGCDGLKDRELSGQAAQVIRERLDRLDAVCGPMAAMARNLRRRREAAV